MLNFPNFDIASNIRSIISRTNKSSIDHQKDDQRNIQPDLNHPSCNQTEQSGPTDKTLETDEASSNELSSRKDKSSEISVFDPGSQKDIIITGHIVDTKHDPFKLTDYLRPLILVTTHREILYSRSEKMNPHVMSAIRRYEEMMGQALSIRDVDMSTIEEIHRKSETANKRSIERDDASQMQRAFINIIAIAAKSWVSDVRFIVNSNNAITRIKIDGVYRKINEMPTQYAKEMLASAFALADESDSSYKYMQLQGARISNQKTELPSGVQSLRLQFNPLANDGRVLIARLLYLDAKNLKGIETLGYSQEQIRQLSIMMARPVGINTFSGPTGSGKSTTMKIVLDKLLADRGNEISLITIEDPPEYVIEGAEQIPVTNARTQEERSEAFTQAIAAGLRSDPDVMMIGEIRDAASANLAVEAAVSGHPIFTSLHANTAMDILTRLRNIGVAEYNIFDPTIFSGLVAQRLIRKLCPHCRMPYNEAHENGKNQQSCSRAYHEYV